jgi:hypothetical protein
MKKQVHATILILTMIALIAASANQAAAITAFPDIVISMINQEPNPVAPGNAFDVKFRIENIGAEPANNMDVKLVLQYPFTVYGNENAERNIGTIAYSGSADLGAVEKWRLLADPNSATGDNNIEFWYRIDKGAWTKAGDFALSVRSGNAFLAINKITTNPNRIIPGTTTNVSFLLENMADNDLRDIKLSLGIYTSTTTAAGVTITELPFTPLGSGNDKTLSRIAKGTSNEAIFNLFTDASAMSKVYKVPYTLSYSDSSGANFTGNGVLGLLVDSDPELSIYIDGSEAQSAGARGKVTVKLVNKGFADIKFLDLKINEGPGFKLISTPEQYIGKLDSDDYETADYTIAIDKDAKDSITLPMSISYRDSNGHLFENKVPLSLKLYTSDELAKNNGGSAYGFWFFAIVIVIAVTAILIYRRIRKNSRKK